METHSEERGSDDEGELCDTCGTPRPDATVPCAFCASEECDTPDERALRVQTLNDALRRNPSDHGRLVMTRGVVARGEAFIVKAIQAVASFEAFTSQNDPYGEHDFAFIDVGATRIFFKVDYYDATGLYLSVNPADAETTQRVLTIGLAEEY